MAKGIGEVWTVQMEWSCRGCGKRIRPGQPARKVGAVEWECPDGCGKAKAKPVQAAMW